MLNKIICTQDGNCVCDNADLKKCKKCEGNMLCLCTRPEVREMVKKLWVEAEAEEQKHNEKTDKSTKV